MSITVSHDGAADHIVASAVEILTGDWRRKGQLEPHDIARIAEKRRLDFDQLHAVLATLKTRGIVAFDKPEPKTYHQARDASAGFRGSLCSPQKMNEKLANVIRVGARLEAASEQSVDALKLIQLGRRARDKFVTSKLKAGPLGST